VPRFPSDITPADLDRLKREREEADRRYHDALASVDGSVLTLPDLPHPPPGPDEHQVTPLNQRWNILEAGDPVGQVSGWRARFARLVWRVVGPVFDRQLAFNSALVDHVNRNIPVQRAIPESVAAGFAVLGDQLAALQAFETRLVVYLQQMTAFVDTKDRNEDLAAAFLALRSALDEVRHQAGNLGVSLASLHQLGLVGKRELDRLLAGTPALGPAEPGTRPDPRAPVLAPDTDAYKYVGFEHRFRGSPEAVRADQAHYLQYFQGAADVLDIGCGRGEFLDLLRERGILARGIDGNHEMVEICRARGLDVREGDVLQYLEALADASLGGIFAAQVVEHLEPAYLGRLLETAYHKLRPGSRIVLETINPASWLAFFSSYLRDPTHVRPVHPDTLEYLLLASGFQQVRIDYRSPVGQEQKLRAVVPSAAGGDLAAWAGVVNENSEKLNRLLFGFLDFAAVAERR
jgi:SAM-dependent methyltransferase